MKWLARLDELMETPVESWLAPAERWLLGAATRLALGLAEGLLWVA